MEHCDRIDAPLGEAIEFCLDRLRKDPIHDSGDIISPGLRYEELIGTLLLAHDVTEEL